MQREGNRTRTVVSVIMERTVSPAPDIRTTTNCVHRPDRMLHAVRRVGWRVSDSVSDYGAIASNHWVRIGEIQTWCSCFRFLLITLDWLGHLRTRCIISDPHRRGRHRLPAKSKRLKGSAVRNSRGVNPFAGRPVLGLGFGGREYGDCENNG